jgi:O-methyltransferase involved in polyketide biosynthesis
MRERKLRMTEFNPRKSNVARMYDWALGGKDNFAVDREAAEKILAKSPTAFQNAFDNRKFLKLAVQEACISGVTQFIDIGSGLPTAENTHEIAQDANWLSRAVYVDDDPVVLAHATAILAKNESSIAIGGDLRNPEKIFSNQALRPFIDLEQPVAVVLVAVLHFLPDPEAYEVVDYIKQAMPSGSRLIISHATADDANPDQIKTVQEVYEGASAPLTMRTSDEVSRFFDGLELIDRGVTDIKDWLDKEDETQSRTACYGGVGVKPKAWNM